MRDEYRTICDTCESKTWYETEQPCKRTYFVGCPTCGSHENISKEVKCNGTLRVIDNSNLEPRLTPFYKSGMRLEIRYKDGEKLRCYVGKSTGWKPIYLAVRKSNSVGGEALYLPDDATIRPINKYR